METEEQRSNGKAGAIYETILRVSPCPRRMNDAL